MSKKTLTPNTLKQIHTYRSLKISQLLIPSKYFILQKPLSLISSNLLNSPLNFFKDKKFFNNLMAVTSPKMTKRFYRKSKKTIKNITPQYGSPLKSFHHTNYFKYRKHFFTRHVPTIGPKPTKFATLLRPWKFWKLTQLFGNNEDTDTFKNSIIVRKTFIIRKNNFTNISSRLLKKKKKQFYNMKSKLKRTMKLYTQSTSTPIIKIDKRNPYHPINKSRKDHSLKITLKHVQTPLNILRSKTSDPLLFTNTRSNNLSSKSILENSLQLFLKVILSKKTLKARSVLFSRLRKRRSRSKITKIDRKIQHVPDSLIKLLYISKRKATKRLILKNQISKSNGLFTLSTLLPYKNNSVSNSTVTKIITHPTPMIRASNTLLLRLSKHTNFVENFSQQSTSQMTMSSRVSKNYIFSNVGLFLNHVSYSSKSKPFNYKYLFKKKIFSFIYPNEARNALMQRKKRITFYKLVYKSKHKMKKSIFYSLKSFNKSFMHQYRSLLENQTNTSQTDLLFHTNSLSKFLKYKKQLPSIEEILYPDVFSHRGTDLSFRITSEVKIPRIRFRPGYQRMWRRARAALKESMGLRFVYQQQLTRYLTRFYRSSSQYCFSSSEMTLNRILMYSRLLPDNPTVDVFLQNKLVYLNGSLTVESDRSLYSNDLVQLIVSMWYYITNRWITNWTLKRHKKFKKLVYRKGLAGKHKVMKLKKQRSYYTPNWVYLARYDISDIKPFLEVDYFTLSSFIIYEPFTVNYYTPDEAPDFRLNIYRMYNWKYIT